MRSRPSDSSRRIPRRGIDRDHLSLEVGCPGTEPNRAARFAVGSAGGWGLVLYSAATQVLFLLLWDRSALHLSVASPRLA